MCVFCICCCCRYCDFVYECLILCWVVVQWLVFYYGGMIDFVIFFKCKYWILLVVVVFVGCVIIVFCMGFEVLMLILLLVVIYVKVDWKVLLVVFDSDLQVGFVVWCSSCVCLRNDVVWVKFCVIVVVVLDKDLVVICQFLQCDFDVYVLCVGGYQVDGLIIGYYELIYFGSLICIDKVMVLVYGMFDDLIVVQLDSFYLELKGKCLCGCVEGKVFKFYDDVGIIVSKGVKVLVLVWLIDLMDLQLLQIQGFGCVCLGDGMQIWLVYVEQNGYFYCVIGCWLVDQGQLKKEDVIMDVICSWVWVNFVWVFELLCSNFSYVFFVCNLDSLEGLCGLLNVLFIVGYSVVVDCIVVLLGSLLWLFIMCLDGSLVVCLVVVQDIGGVIVGEVCVDLYWGSGDVVGKLVGDMKQKGNIWMLWLKGVFLLN